MNSNRNDAIYKDYECFNHLVNEVTEEIFSLLKDPEDMPEYPKGIADCWDPGIRWVMN